MTATLAVRPTTVEPTPDRDQARDRARNRDEDHDRAFERGRRAPAEIRVVPAPRSEPPSDEELRTTGTPPAPMGAPLLPFVLPGTDLRGDRTRTTLVRLAGQAAADALLAQSDGPPPSPVRIATRLFLSTCVEVIGGFRPMAQLRPFCRPDEFDAIADRLAGHPVTAPASRSRALTYLTGRAPVSSRGANAPPRAPRLSHTGPGERVSVRRVQICEIAPTVAEVAVVLGRHEQAWAMALRFELYRGRWLCSLIEVI